MDQSVPQILRKIHLKMRTNPATLLVMGEMLDRIDRRIELAHRLQQECFEAIQPWIEILVDIENRHFPKLYHTPVDGVMHREDNYHPDDAGLRAKIQQVIADIQKGYQDRVERF